MSTSASGSGIRHKLRSLSADQKFLLVVLGATTFFDGYDRSILEIALPQIRASYDITQSTASAWIALLYLGAVPALFLARRADRHGRRQLLLISVIGYTIATAATALAPSIAAYAVCQFVARLFLVAEHAVVWALAAEELPDDARGLGFGILAMNSALGVGLSAIVYGGVLEPAGVSWRWMYAASLPTLALVALLRRRLPESRRFEAVRAASALAPSWRTIFRPPYGRVLALVAAATFASELITHASVFVLDFLQTERGLSATATSAMLIGAGIPGIPAMVAAGSLSDRYGRRLVGCAAGLVTIAGALGFFWVPGGVAVLLPTMSLMLIGSMASVPVLNGYAVELFPTALRGQAGSWTAVARVAGQATSLVVGAALLATTNSLPFTTTLLGAGSLVAVWLYATAFPDTHNRELIELDATESALATSSTPLQPARAPE